ncbi:hypothetical protein [Deefgea rivuli]|uniref:hypothetical protein n=1 Tax=Deefgea rivuli TaxID=400948 RepID=UPI001B80BA0A|nr:hypothetical protein [Deefgea rivuli]
MTWALIYTKAAQKDALKIAAYGLKENAKMLLAALAENPLQNPPPDKKLVGDLDGAYSRRITSFGVSSAHRSAHRQSIKNVVALRINAEPVWVSYSMQKSLEKHLRNRGYSQGGGWINGV